MTKGDRVEGGFQAFLHSKALMTSFLDGPYNEYGNLPKNKASLLLSRKLLLTTAAAVMEVNRGETAALVEYCFAL